MLTKNMIKQECNSTTYTRGLDLYYSNAINNFEVIEEPDIDMDYISADVEGSNYNRYSVNIDFDFEENIVESISCECVAFRKYNGICKHCVAVLLYYMDDQKRKMREMEQIGRQGKALLELEKMQQTVRTTPSMQQLLSTHIMKRTLPMMQDESYGKVHLEPYLYMSENALFLEFKIGIAQMYVLKDVFAFDDALENCQDVHYGKKLKFIHTLEAFESKSRPLVQFLREWVWKNRKHYIQTSYYGYSYSYKTPKLREIPIYNEDLEALVEVIGDKDLMANMDYMGYKPWTLTDEKLRREMFIEGIIGGIRVSINRYSGFQGKSVNIYFHENKIYRINRSEMEPISDFLKYMTDIPDRTVTFNETDVPLFCRELLPVLQVHFNCKKVNFNEAAYGILPVSFEFYLDAPQKECITCKVLAVYGEEKYNIYDEPKQNNKRDIVKEIEVSNVILPFFNAFDEEKKLMVVAEDEEKIYSLLVSGIEYLQSLGEVYVSDAVKRFNVVSASKVAVGVSLSGDLMTLKLTAEDISKEQLVEILTKYDRKRKYYRLKNGDFVNVDNEEMEALLELKQGLHLTKKQLEQDVIDVPKYRALYLNEELSEKMPFHTIKDKPFKALIRNMKTVEDSDFDVPESLQNILREYQKSGYLWLKTLKHNGFGGILADDMGLGKTLQVICFLLSEYLETKEDENRKALIVCPASLVFNWKDEINRFAPQLPVKMITGIAKERREILKKIGNKDILVTSYDLLKRDIEYYENFTFYCEVIDEAQYIKNHNTQAAKAVKLVNARFKLGLTGTPIENRLSELWSIFDYLMPGYLYGYKKFREELELPIVQNQEEKAINRLHKMITPFVLRRLKKDVLTDLPDKIEECIYANFEGEQQQLYDAHVKRLQLLLDKQSNEEYKSSKIQVLSELTKLRQICCDPTLLYEDYKAGSVKMNLCMELVKNAISGGHKILLFSQFTSMLDTIQKHLKREKIAYYSLTGAISKEKRAKMVEAFNKDETPVFCISLKAGGTGLNLVAADIVIHFDPWWNIAVQNQATDRAHRIGQKNAVNVYKLIVKGTIEENIVKLQEIKKDLAEQVLSSEGINVGSFDKEALLELLK